MMKSIDFATNYTQVEEFYALQTSISHNDSEDLDSGMRTDTLFDTNSAL